MLGFWEAKNSKIKILSWKKNNKNVWDVTVDYIVISKLVKTKTNFNYLIGYLNKVVRPLVLILPKMSGYSRTFKVNACVHYFYQIFIFSPNDSSSKTMKNAFYFIQKAHFVPKIFIFLYFHCSLFFSLSAIDRNSITHFVSYLEKKKRYDSENLSIDVVSNKEHFYGEIM